VNAAAKTVYTTALLMTTSISYRPWRMMATPQATGTATPKPSAMFRS
jgi:hypothetical protein